MTISKPTAQEVIDFAGLDTPASVVTQWIDDLAVMAADCLESLNAAQQEMALRYLVAHYLSGANKDGKELTSESLGDASWTFASVSGEGLRTSNYGKLALQVAPCLVSLGADKRYTVRVI